jgi:3-hydroxymyristoyl/3-hydroxydecanoyl-(acyl carrier protein) dehydratase
MAGRFAAFSFVDRITSLAPGVRAEGFYLVPAGIARFAPSLMAEAVGQLAAWAAMARLDFRLRPVAGLAAETLYRGRIAPGERLDLAVEIDACDDEAIAYRGAASRGGACLLELDQCVGPMLPMAEFDSPEAMREDLATLCGAGAPSGRFTGVPELACRIVEHARGEALRAELEVPAAAAFFTDHFPRRPVLPGTLLVDCQATLAQRLAREAAPLQDAPGLETTRVCDVKMRSFVSPGQLLEIRVALIEATAAGARLSVAARADGKGVAAARIEVAPTGGGR